MQLGAGTDENKLVQSVIWTHSDFCQHDTGQNDGNGNTVGKFSVWERQRGEAVLRTGRCAGRWSSVRFECISESLVRATVC